MWALHTSLPTGFIEEGFTFRVTEEAVHRKALRLRKRLERSGHISGEKLVGAGPSKKLVPWELFLG
jgi:hypothetical protein